MNGRFKGDCAMGFVTRIVGILSCTMLATAQLGCSQRLLDYTVLTTRNVDVSGISRGERISGEDCVFVLLILPLGIPSWKTAMDQALENGKGDVLLDVVITNKGWWFLVGQNCVEVAGTVGRVPSYKSSDQRAAPAVPSASKSSEQVPGSAAHVATPPRPPPPAPVALDRQLDQLDELKAKGRITEDEHALLRRRLVETTPLAAITMPIAPAPAPAPKPEPLPLSLAGRWRTEGTGRLEITDTAVGQVRWEYESTERGTLYRMRGTGAVDGDRLELTGAYTAGDSYSLNKPCGLSLRRDGPLLLGTFTGSLNTPRLLRFSKEP